MDDASPRYGIIGDGRLARHLSRYLTLLRVPFRQWSRRGDGDPARALAGCQVVLVLISDHAIEGFIRERLSASPAALAHCSGSLETKLAQCVHPLMTFGPELMSLEEYAAVPFVTERGARPFPELFPELKNPHYEIPSGSRPLYHALCVLAGNFSVLLWRKLFREFHSRLGLPASAVQPYLRQVCRNIAADPETALTGPLQRGDRAAMTRNLEALKGDPFAKVYEAFVSAAGGEK